VSLFRPPRYHRPDRRHCRQSITGRLPARSLERNPAAAPNPPARMWARPCCRPGPKSPGPLLRLKSGRPLWPGAQKDLTTQTRWSRRSSTPGPPRSTRAASRSASNRRRPTRLSLAGDASLLHRSRRLSRIVYGASAPTAAVGANKNAIKTIVINPISYAQGYFVYDSKEIRFSHRLRTLRVSRSPIHSCHLVQQAHLVPATNGIFSWRFDLPAMAACPRTLLLNSPFSAEEVANALPASVRQAIRGKQADGAKHRRHRQSPVSWGLGRAHQHGEQTCRSFALADVLPQQQGA